MNNYFDAFISYERADSKAFATKLHARLLEEGFKVWKDKVRFCSDESDRSYESGSSSFLISSPRYSSTNFSAAAGLILQKAERYTQDAFAQLEAIWQQRLSYLSTHQLSLETPGKNAITKQISTPTQTVHLERFGSAISGQFSKLRLTQSIPTSLFSLIF